MTSQEPAIEQEKRLARPWPSCSACGAIRVDRKFLQWGDAMTATATCSFDIEFVRNVTVIRFTIDSLDESNIEVVADELHALMYNQRPRRVVVDMAALRQIDDLGLAVVQSFHDAVGEVGGTAILCRLTLPVMEAVNASGLNRVLHIRPSLNEALWTF